MNEQWSFVGSKKQQHWLFHAWEPRIKKIIAHAFGSKSKETLKKLMKISEIASIPTMASCDREYSNSSTRSQGNSRLQPH